MRRWLLVIGLTVVLLLGSAYAVLRVKFEGEDLAENIASILNKRMRGRIAIGSIEWPAGALETVVTGGWVPVTMRDVRVWDDCALSAELLPTDGSFRQGDPTEDCTNDDGPDPAPASRRKPRKLLLRTARITAEVDIHALMFGNHDFVFRHVWVHGGEALLEETREPYPLHAVDRTSVSIVTAFVSRMTAGFRAGIYADKPPPIFDVRDIHIEDLNLTVHMKPTSLPDDRVVYGFTARFEGIDVDAGEHPANDAYVYMDASDPLVAKFYVRLGLTADRGTIRVLDTGPRTSFRLPHDGPTPVPEVYPPPGRSADYTIDLVDVKLHRLAQLPTEWGKHDFVANTLELDLEARTLPCATLTDRTRDPAKGATLRFSGELNQWWDRPYDGSWNLGLEVQNGGPTVRTCIKESVGGEDLHGTITLTGPFVAAPKIGLDLANLDVDVPLSQGAEPIRLTLAEVRGGIDLVNEQGFIDRTKALIKGGKEPGEIQLAATFGLDPPYSNAQVEITKAIDVGRFLPPRVASSVGRFLKGRLRAKGDVELGFALEDFDLALGQTAAQTALRVHKGRLFTPNSFDSIHIENVQVEAGRSRATFDGTINVLHEEIESLTIDGDFPDLGTWLKRFGLPAFVTSAGAGTVIVVKGKFSNPTVNLNTTLAGVPCVDTLRLIDTQYADGIVDIRRLTTKGLGGEVSGSGRVRMGAKGAPPFIERLKLSGRRVEAAKLCGLGSLVKGTVEAVDAELTQVSIVATREPLDWLDHATVYARAPRLTILGEAYSDLAVCVNRKDDAACRPRTLYVDDADLEACARAKRTGGSCVVTTARRDQGGVLDATIAKLPPVRTGGKLGLPQLGGALSIDLPLAILEQFVGARVAGGDARLSLHLSGSPTAPQADGNLTMLRTWVANAFVGDTQLRVQPIKLASGMAGVAIDGRALAGRLVVSGTVGTSAPYPVELSVTGRRIEVDVLTDLTAMLGLTEPVQAWASGTVTVRTQLAPVTPVEPEAWVELTELVGIVNHRGADGRLVPLRMSVIDQQPGARPAMSLRVTPSSLELTCRDRAATGGRRPCTTQVATPAGVIEIRGHAAPTSVAIEAVGTMDLALIAPLLDNRFDEVSGQVRLAASVAGTFAKPTYEASLDLDPDGLWRKDPTRANPIRLRPIGGDTVLEAPVGLIKLANGSLGFTDVNVQVRDQHLDEKGELHIGGNIALDGLTPASWSVLISGKIAGKMLLAAVPDMVSQAGGLAAIDGDLILSGKGTLPQISGSLVFDPPADGSLRPISVLPRGVRREIALTRGSVDIETSLGGGGQRTYTISINGVQASIDGEGQVSGITGQVELRDGVLTSLGIGMDANNIPFRIPGTLDLTIAARDVSLTLASETAPLEVRGNISIIDGSYLQNVELTEQIRQIGSSTAPGKPFWEEYPLLGDANLRLTLDVRRFAVRNNIAQIELVGPLIEITNTPRDPRMSGSIRVQRGEFRIPATRAKFTSTTGSIDFAENTRAGDPQLAITSEAQYQDLSGQQHLITLTLFGALSNPQWDLRTSTGLNKSQTLSLLVLGRSQEALRRSLGDQSVGSDPTLVDPTTNPSQGFADQIVKDLAGDWVSGLLGDSLTRATRLDVFRLEIGFGSIGLRIEKKFIENLNAIADGEQTIRGSTYNVRGELKTPYKLISGGDYLTLQGGYLRKNFYDPAEQDISDASLKLVYRLYIP